MIIGNHNINCDGVYVIAEIGNNHNGSLKEQKNLLIVRLTLVLIV